MTKILLSLILLGSLSSCGQGFKDEKEKPERQQQEQRRGQSSSTESEEFIRLLNQRRVKLGLRPLVYDYTIQEIAESHAYAMAKRTRPFGHAGMRVRCNRIRNRVGDGRKKKCGELVSWGQATPSKAFENWLKSEDHRQEMDEEKYTHAGIGFYKDYYGHIYWTLMLAEI